MADTTPMLRQWILLRMLSARRYGVTLRELAAEAGVSPKTIGRDLNLLKQVGFQINETVGEHGRKHWKLEAANGSSPSEITPPEKNAPHTVRLSVCWKRPPPRNHLPTV